MDNEKRDSRRIKNKFTVYVKTINEKDLEKYKDEIYYTIEPSDSFSFFMSLNNLDSSFGDLNKAFVLIMKEMDSKLNYIIDILRDRHYDTKLKEFEQSYSCDLSQRGLSFLSNRNIKENDLVFIKFMLPIASHYEIKSIAAITRKIKTEDGFCYGCTFKEIKKSDIELIIHYMLFFERKMIKNRKLEYE